MLYFMKTYRILAIFTLLLVGAVASNASTSSKALEHKVAAVIENDYPEQAFEVSANDNGSVQVKGEVPTLYDKLFIFEAVSKVNGVKKIDDLVTVATPTVPDNIIKDNVSHSLRNVKSILEPDRINVAVDNGVVFLKGDVSFYREKLMATTVVSWQEGVKGLENDLTVLSPSVERTDANLEVVFNEILKNQFAPDSQVSFSVNNGVVVLSGKVPKIWDKRTIQDEFSRIRGVKKVVNHLTIDPLA